MKAYQYMKQSSSSHLHDWNLIAEEGHLIEAHDLMPPDCRMYAKHHIRYQDIHTWFLCSFPGDQQDKVSISRNWTWKKFQYSKWRTSFCPILLKADIHWPYINYWDPNFFLKVKHDYAPKWFIPKLSDINS